MNRQRSTIKDVAALAQVSIKTVSRVVNKEQAVGEKTREKVEAAIKKLNYQPNLAARNLAATKNYALGYVYDNPNAYYILDMQKGILSECREQGYELVIHPCNYNNNTIEQLNQMINRSQLAGLIISPPLSENQAILDSLEKSNIPFIRIISKGDDSLCKAPCIAVDDRQAAFDITAHLLEQGHTKLGFLKGDETHRSTQQRILGFTDALNKVGVDINPSWIIEGEYTFDCGVTGVKRILSQNSRPSAIVACNDEIAAGAVFAARLEGIKVPQELAVAGFEDSPFSRQTSPKITTASQQNEEIAKRATASLIKHIVAKQAPPEPITIVYKPSLVVRESTQLEIKQDEQQT